MVRDCLSYFYECSGLKAEKRDIVGILEQLFVWKVIELQDKYLAYVNERFRNHTLFHKTKKEAFEVFCYKGVAGGSIAELLASICDNILKEGNSGKLSNEAIEETLEKIWNLESPDPNFTLDGHQKGVNCVDYSTGGDKPYLVTSFDDHKFTMLRGEMTQMKEEVASLKS